MVPLVIFNKRAEDQHLKDEGKEDKYLVYAPLDIMSPSRQA